MLAFAKFQIDVGLATEQREETLAFWRDEIGLRFDHTLSVGGGVQQHRHEFRGSVVKINHSRDPLPDGGRTGIRRLLLARPDIDSPLGLHDPDGNAVVLVPPGHEGVTQLAVELGVRDLGAARRFWGLALGLPPEPRGPDSYRLGDSVVRLRADAAAPADPPQWGTGYRYVTVQVFDADDAYRTVVDAGGRPATEPATFGGVARFGFVRDPEGNWLELSQRASLTGPLPA